MLRWSSLADDWIICMVDSFVLIKWFWITNTFLGRPSKVLHSWIRDKPWYIERESVFWIAQWIEGLYHLQFHSNLYLVCKAEYLFIFKLLIGLGFPFEGPAPLDALASGCFYINPKVYETIWTDDYMNVEGNNKIAVVWQWMKQQTFALNSSRCYPRKVIKHSKSRLIPQYRNK